MGIATRVSRVAVLGLVAAGWACGSRSQFHASLVDENESGGSGGTSSGGSSSSMSSGPMGQSTVASSTTSSSTRTSSGGTTTSSGGQGGTGAVVGSGGSGGSACSPSDPDSDGDGVCDSLDRCAFGDDGIDTDGDGIPDACDDCGGARDQMDSDGDGTPDGCDTCPGFDDTEDEDEDTIADGCDRCPGFDDLGDDADDDGIPDSCDVCPGFDDLGPDFDGDGIANQCDQCPGHDDGVDTNMNSIPDGCEQCDPDTEVEFDELCYYLDGSAGTCDPGYELAPQSVLSSLSVQFAGKTYKHQRSDNCCITHANVELEGQDWGMPTDTCNYDFPFPQGPQLGAVGCTDQHMDNPAQLTLCRTSCPSEWGVPFDGKCYYLDGTAGVCADGYQLAPQSALEQVAPLFVGRTFRTQTPDNCCIWHSQQETELQDWGVPAGDCQAVTFTTGPTLGALGCTNTVQDNPKQATLCVSN